MAATLFLALALVLGSTTATAPPEEEILGLYPDFEATGALVLGLGELVEHHPAALVAIIEALADEIAIIGVVANDAQKDAVDSLLAKSGAPTKKLDIVQVPVVGMWIRDYGPFFIRLPDARVMALDALYVRKEHATDDWVPRYLAGYFRLPVVDVPLRIAGGNLLTNGEGWVFTTSQVLEFNGKDGLTQNDVGQILVRYYGATDWIVLRPLAGEPTQHADMFLTLVAPDVAVVSQIEAETDPVNARLLDDAASQLAAVKTRSGPMRVVRVPMPGHEDGKWRSYTNVIFADKTLLVPSYPDKSPAMDERVLEIYRELLPGHRVVQVDASSIIEKNGSLHCISINVPVLPRKD